MTLLCPRSLWFGLRLVSPLDDVRAPHIRVDKKKKPGESRSSIAGPFRGAI
jgi:hypothetical protein